MRLFSQLSWYFLSEWRRYVGAVCFLIIIAILQLVPPRLVGVVVDGISNQTMATSQLVSYVALMLFIAVVVYGLRYVWRIWLFGASYKLAVQLRQKFYRQLSLQNQSFYLRYRTGDLIARTTNDVDRVVFAAGEGVLTFVDSLVMGCAVLIMMSVEISWQLTLLALIPMPIMALVIKRYGDQLHHRFKHAQGAFSSLNNHAQESLTSIRMIKAFGLEDHQSNQFEQVATEAGRRNMHVARVDARFDPTIFIAIGMANLLAIGGGSWMVLQGTLTLGELTSFVMYLGLMIWPMLALAWMFNIVERGSAAYSRIRSLLDEPLDIEDGHQSLDAEKGALSARIKTFSYPETDRVALHDIQFDLKPGQFLGLCGPTGSGKSTLITLIQRQFDVTEGAISYQGKPLPEIRLDEWRGRLAVVNQSPFLFSDTIAGNIALGNPQATVEQIEEAARIACVHDDILRLPEGYQTQVGERGVMLSGGQKQRISIARAILQNAEILILDDALSAVDGQTEFTILQNLSRWREGKTLIISAHRLSALVDADNILVLSQGSIAAEGIHSTLSVQPGWYKDMYHYQQIEATLDGDL
ncbi:SmdA family multidrug ABC transporter permease/ATP-binding protein [Providencia stuartii]|uniref:Multidrug resistance-like ATP-binding protein MdlA n=1 Tax=Providencia stuartii (strain MRSN 2154) TaxID=1157951 RepID=A0A140NKP3_PROSM|nr:MULTISPECIES: SmdA family multidrug ABC transporter permease/ATP-binding protein [Providencia]AFH93217.1 putative multidrug transporter membrane\ATP-binding components [Providencia stuartii MRSN 2154]MDE8746546.1 SmdA family multidrug ABC transporter permease/ATP-binding protein [Providencia thailandensis]MDE8765301.1 SmdA family multidrug ABC transporter permease/ATP-binding protein [Providencia thailandensis]MDE8777701.1 SmdA family multidrug ABC transporter permease/ATP-binding protein [P